MRSRKPRSLAAVTVVALVLATMPGAALGGASDPRARPVRSASGVALGPATGVAAASAPTAAAAIDDDVPGIALEPLGAEVTGSVQRNVDWWDVYSVFVAPGEQVSLLLDFADDGARSDLQLLAPQTLTVGAPVGMGVPTDPAQADQVVVCTPATTYGPGTYYIMVEVLAAAPSTDPYDYTLRWQVSAPSDGNAPGSILPASPVSDALDVFFDGDDVHRVLLAPGQSFAATVTAGAGAPAFEARLFGPGLTDVWTGSSLVTKAGPSAEVTYTVPPGEEGWYYLWVFCANGRGEYSIEWQAHDDALPGVALPASPAPRVLSTVWDYYQVPLEWGETFTWRLDAGAGLSARLYRSAGVDEAGVYHVVFEDMVAAGKTLSYTAPMGTAGHYYLEVWGVAGTPYTLSWNVGRSAVRASGTSRFSTAVAVSRANFPDGAGTAIVANGMGFADALSASSLAGVYGAPILLTLPTSLPSEVRTELARLGVGRVIIVGGTSAVSPGVASALSAVSGVELVERLSGSDRYLTSQAVAERVRERLPYVRAGTPSTWGGACFVARGDGFADALAVSPFAYSQAMPVLLTPTTSLPVGLESFMSGLGITDVTVAGGTNAVSQAVEDDLASSFDVLRLQGPDRYWTAAAIADYGAFAEWGSFASTGLATGASFPDALGGGAGIGRRQGVLLLTQSATLTPATADVLETQASYVRQLQIYGGTGAVGAGVAGSVNAILP